MKSRILIIVISLLFVFTYGRQVDASFQDWLKKTTNKLGGEKGLSEDEIINGLKQALEVGTNNAVATVSRTDGYLKNPEIRIPLPENLMKAEKLLRATGFGNQIDEFELSMNRAAERAAPEAKTIFLDAVKQMSFTDAARSLMARTMPRLSIFRVKPRVVYRRFLNRLPARPCPRSALPVTIIH